MKRSYTSTVWVGALAWGGIVLGATVPPPEQLLPADTLAVLTAPDWGKVEAAQKETPAMLLWNDEAMRPFREKLMNKLRQDVIEPLERELGAKLTDYTDLIRGQVTLAVTQNGWTGGKEPLPGLLVLLDTKDKSEQLAKNLAAVQKKLTDAGKKLKLDKIRDVEFATLVVDPKELRKAVDKPLGSGDKDAGGQAKDKADEAKPGEAQDGPKFALSFGQAGALLLVGTSLKDLEKVLVRLSGGGVPSLAEQPAFESCSKAMFREAQAYGWVHVAPLGEVLTKLLTEASAGQDANPMAPKPITLLAASGLTGLRTLAFSISQNREGEYVDAFLGVPAEKRKGLFALLHTEAKEAAPPAFVPAETTQFWRWRWESQKAWAALETLINEVSPGAVSFVLGSLEGPLKEKDPNFDFRRNFIANLGDDVIGIQRAPRGKSVEELTTPPSLFLLASPNGEQLIQTFKSLLKAVPMPMLEQELAFKEREFLGRKIHALDLPAVPGAAGSKPRQLHLATSGGYIALSLDGAMVEEYLRSSESKPKPLSETPGLADATQKVGGSANGLFGYQNDLENMRSVFEALKANPNFLEEAFLSPLGLKPTGDEKAKSLKDWVDFSLLPPFDRIAKYLYLSVYAGKLSSEGFSLKVFSPTPPQMKQ